MIYPQENSTNIRIFRITRMNKWGKQESREADACKKQAALSCDRPPKLVREGNGKAV
jgi:hypothetical protein